MPKAAYHLIHPDTRSTSVVFASPHSGRDYPQSFQNTTLLSPLEIRSSEDAYVDKLFDIAPRFGAPFLRAGAPRAFLDLNRACDELDPAVIEDVRRAAHNPRIASGLGVIPRVVAQGRSIYRGKLPLSVARHRIDTYWRPYHDMLQTLLDQSQTRFGEAILIDCHSMPTEALDNAVTHNRKRPDIVLGDRYGAAAAPRVVDQVEQALQKAGLNVVRNMPFAGAYIAQHYGRPSRKQHVIQIEIDRALYLDEKHVEPSPDFEAFKSLLQGVIADISLIGSTGELPLAAE
ncbi:N-formylglutamate amidohydrolase [Aestuariibius sp. HNIBRBA575]|uniref:N-formylglutamate amidohydrolase n=1 Tax=Aestuariibius sp. HNIBRBA575 TaxID=3233343 RepID=UPI0034A192EE